MGSTAHAARDLHDDDSSFILGGDEVNQQLVVELSAFMTRETSAHLSAVRDEDLVEELAILAGLQGLGLQRLSDRAIVSGESRKGNGKAATKVFAAGAGVQLRLKPNAAGLPTVLNARRTPRMLRAAGEAVHIVC